MTDALIEGKSWSHNERYPEFPLPRILSYIGFHLLKDEVEDKVKGKDGATGEIYSSFQGAHPAMVGIRENGKIDIIPRLGITSYRVTFGGQKIVVNSINDPDAINKDVVLFTPALRTPEVEKYITVAESSAGVTDGWKTYAPMIPIADVGDSDADDRINVFITNEGNGQVPIEKVMMVWEGRSPLPSFGAVLSFRKEYFESLFVDAEEFKNNYLGQKIQITPSGDASINKYVQIMGGFVPVVVNGEHVYCVETVDKVMRNLSHYGNAISPIAQAGRETKNFDPRVREPAGVLAQTENQIGWVLFDGRHELSIGASVVDVAVILKKMEMEGVFNDELIQQAIFIDGGSAMKAYHIRSDGTTVTLDLLNRVAAGSRNGPGADRDGLNLYTLLALSLSRECVRVLNLLGRRGNKPEQVRDSSFRLPLRTSS